jgi:hypothetical protein
MRPTITEQLRETRRILQDVIAPCIHDEHPATVLSYLLSNLQTLEDSWSRVLPFLHWDNTETSALLQVLASRVDSALGNDIRAALELTSPDAFDVEAVSAHNFMLRQLLTRCVQTCDDTELEATRAHLMTRASRFPMRPAPRVASR